MDQALIEITPSQRNFVCANRILRPGLFAFPGQGVDRGHVRGRSWSFPEEKKGLVAQLELLGDRLIPRQVRVMEIIQQTAALPDHDQEATAGAVVFDIFLQMFGQMIDALGQKSDLHVSGPCVALVQSEPCYRLSFFHISVRSIYFEQAV
jgi:hypothetical protein